MGGQRPIVPLLLIGPPFFKKIITYLSTTLLTRMTSVSLHVQWPLASQLHGSILKENNCFFITDQTPSNHLPVLRFLWYPYIAAAAAAATGPSVPVQNLIYYHSRFAR
jgi:hypothetical protein